MTTANPPNPLDAFWSNRLKNAATDLHFDQPEIAEALKDLHPDQVKAIRILCEGSYCAGYYHDGYTHDSAYSSQKASECADEMLQYANIPAQLIDDSRTTGVGPFDHERTDVQFDAVISRAIFDVIGHPDLLNGEASLKTTLRSAIAGLYAQASRSAKLNESYSDLLRSLAFYLSAGGYNSDGLIDPRIAEEKIRWGIDAFAKGAHELGILHATVGHTIPNYSLPSGFADGKVPESVAATLRGPDVTIDAELRSGVPDALLEALQAYSSAPSRTALMHVLGMVVANTADLRVEVARLRQQTPVTKQDIDFLNKVARLLMHFPEAEAFSAPYILETIAKRLNAYWLNGGLSEHDQEAKRQLNWCRRDFAMRVAYEIGSWVPGELPQPDVQAIVDSMLEKDNAPWGAKPTIAEPDSYKLGLEAGWQFGLTADHRGLAHAKATAPSSPPPAPAPAPAPFVIPAGFVLAPERADPTMIRAATALIRDGREPFSWHVYEAMLRSRPVVPGYTHATNQPAGTQSGEPDAYMVVQANGKRTHLFFNRVNAEALLEGNTTGCTIEALRRDARVEVLSNDGLDAAFLLRHLLAMRSVIADDAYAARFPDQKYFREALLTVFDGSSLDLNGVLTPRDNPAATDPGATTSGQ
jgi:hypothetical protein